MKAKLNSPDRAKVPVVLYRVSSRRHRGPVAARFDRQWDVIWSTDGIAGAFIWEWQEQGMYDQFPERWYIPSPGARGTIARPAIASPARDGAVTADRQIKPNRYSISSRRSIARSTPPPREVTPAGGQCVVPLQNRYSFTDLSELTCHWQALAGERYSPAAKATSPPNPARPSMPLSPPPPAWIPCAWNSSTRTGAASIATSPATPRITKAPRLLRSSPRRPDRRIRLQNAMTYLPKLKDLNDETNNFTLPTSRLCHLVQLCFRE